MSVLLPDGDGRSNEEIEEDTRDMGSTVTSMIISQDGRSVRPKS